MGTFEQGQAALLQAPEKTNPGYTIPAKPLLFTKATPLQEVVRTFMYKGKQYVVVNEYKDESTEARLHPKEVVYLAAPTLLTTLLNLI